MSRCSNLEQGDVAEFCQVDKNVGVDAPARPRLVHRHVTFNPAVDEKTLKDDSD